MIFLLVCKIVCAFDRNNPPMWIKFITNNLTVFEFAKNFHDGNRDIEDQFRHFLRDFVNLYQPTSTIAEVVMKITGKSKARVLDQLQKLEKLTEDSKLYEFGVGKSTGKKIMRISQAILDDFGFITVALKQLGIDIPRAQLFLGIMSNFNKLTFNEFCRKLNFDFSVLMKWKTAIAMGADGTSTMRTFHEAIGFSSISVYEDFTIALASWQNSGFMFTAQQLDRMFDFVWKYGEEAKKKWDELLDKVIAPVVFVIDDTFDHSHMNVSMKASTIETLLHNIKKRPLKQTLNENGVSDRVIDAVADHMNDLVNRRMRVRDAYKDVFGSAIRFSFKKLIWFTDEKLSMFSFLSRYLNSKNKKNFAFMKDLSASLSSADSDLRIAITVLGNHYNKRWTQLYDDIIASIPYLSDPNVPLWETTVFSSLSESEMSDIQDVFGHWARDPHETFIYGDIAKKEDKSSITEKAAFWNNIASSDGPAADLVTERSKMDAQSVFYSVGRLAKRLSQVYTQHIRDISAIDNLRDLLDDAFRYLSGIGVVLCLSDTSLRSVMDTISCDSSIIVDVVQNVTSVLLSEDPTVGDAMNSISRCFWNTRETLQAFSDLSVLSFPNIAKSIRYENSNLSFTISSVLPLIRMNQVFLNLKDSSRTKKVTVENLQTATGWNLARKVVRPMSFVSHLTSDRLTPGKVIERLTNTPSNSFMIASHYAMICVENNSLGISEAQSFSESFHNLLDVLKERYLRPPPPTSTPWSVIVNKTPYISLGVSLVAVVTVILAVIVYMNTRAEPEYSDIEEDRLVIEEPPL